VTDPAPPSPDLLAACEASHARLDARLAVVDDETVRRPSRLAGWSIGHVLTHLARNADSFVRMLEAAAGGASAPQYPGGTDQRNEEIEAGARRNATAIVADVRSASRRLDDAFAAATPLAWSGRGLAPEGLPAPLIARLPLRRLREVELHHVDLGLGYEPEDWPEEFVALVLPEELARVPARIADPRQRAAVLAWVAGRRGSPGEVELAPF